MIARHVIAFDVGEPEWISFERSFPSEAVLVLVCLHAGKVCSAYRVGTKWFDSAGDPIRGAAVVAWAPIGRPTRTQISLTEP